MRGNVSWGRRPNAGNAGGRPVENSSAHLLAPSNQKLDHRGLGLLRVLRSGEGVLVDASFQRAAAQRAQTQCLESLSQALGIEDEADERLRRLIGILRVFQGEALAELIKYPRGGAGSVTDRVGEKRGGKANLPVLKRAWRGTPVMELAASLALN